VAEKVVDYIDNLNISIDGTPDVHNKVRRENSFEKIIEGIKKVEEIKKRKKKDKPYILIIYTISDLNYRDLFSTVEYLNKLNFRIDTALFIHQMFIPQRVKNEYLNRYSNIFKMSNIFSGFTYVPEKINIVELFQEIEKVKNFSKKLSFNIDFFPNFKKEDIKTYYEDRDEFPQIAPVVCITPFTNAFILPEGEVWNCPLNIVGNIKEDNFSSIWNNEKARKFRRELIINGKFRICKNCCGLYT
jgi:MoaA/NifB/PqqE/SkfB family radical SAM enzyme